MGYAFRNDINPREKTPENIEIEADWIMNHVRGRSYASPFAVGDRGVFRPRKPKDCYCGFHSLRKGRKNRDDYYAS